MGDLPKGAVPFLIPVRVPAKKRDDWQRKLEGAGIFLPRLVDRWNFLPEKPGDRFQRERKYIDEHLLVPVSEHYDIPAMEYLVSRINGLS